jgi:hypothetical protein
MFSAASKSAKATLTGAGDAVLVPVRDGLAVAPHQPVVDHGVMALLNPPAPTAIQVKKPEPKKTSRRSLRATAWLPSLAKQHATSYTTPGGRDLTRQRLTATPAGLRRHPNLS